MRTKKMKKKIKSKCGKHDIIFDEEDHQKLLEFAPNGWEARLFTASNNYYAVTRKTKDGQRKGYLMHRVIMNILHDPSVHVDHINNNTLDNRKENLRFVTPRENMKNRTSKKNSACKYLGVAYCNSKRGSKKYRVHIKDKLLHHNSIHLGYYYDEDSAGYAYNVGADLIHKEYANPNQVIIENVVDQVAIEEYVKDRVSKYL